MSPATGGVIPAWWRTDREHAPMVYASDLLHKALPIDENGSPDFEAWWKQPFSSGERILVALAWTLYNIGWAMDQERREAKRKSYTGGPLYWSNPCRALATLGPEHWAAYMHMIDLAGGGQR